MRNCRLAPTVAACHIGRAPNSTRTHVRTITEDHDCKGWDHTCHVHKHLSAHNGPGWDMQRQADPSRNANCVSSHKKQMPPADVATGTPCRAALYTDTNMQYTSHAHKNVNHTHVMCGPHQGMSSMGVWVACPGQLSCMCACTGTDKEGLCADTATA
jgi:hypothetical protein